MTNDEAREILKRVEIAKPIKFEDYADMREALDMAIKALEPKTGHWKEWDKTFGRNIYYCTACGRSLEILYEYDFCPNCGAKMEDEE